jgi:DNA repair exonuclease SbcCD ATPase subunit
MGDILGDVVSAVGSLIGTNQTNQKNWDIAQANNQWSAQQYATRYQTTVKDLEAAGLNPMLAYSQGAGTAPTASQVAPMQNALGNAVDSYQRSKSTSAQASLQKQQEAVAQSQVELNSASAAKQNAEANVANEQAELIKRQVPKTQQEEKTSAELAKAYIQQAGASAAQAAQAYEQIKNIAQNNQNLKEELKRLQQANDQNKPESEIAKKYPTFYYIFHKLMPTLSGNVGNISKFIPR